MKRKQKPVVVIYVNGGVMDYVAPKSVKVLSFDWDNLELAESGLDLDAAMRDAVQIPHRGDRRHVMDRIYAIKRAQADTEDGKRED